MKNLSGYGPVNPGKDSFTFSTKTGYTILKIPSSSKMVIEPGYFYMYNTFRAHDGGRRRAHNTEAYHLYSKKGRLSDIDTNTGNGPFFKYPNSDIYYFSYYKSEYISESSVSASITLLVDKMALVKVRYTYKDNIHGNIDTVTCNIQLETVYRDNNNNPIPPYRIDITRCTANRLIDKFFIIDEDGLYDYTLLMVEILGYADE